MSFWKKLVILEITNWMKLEFENNVSGATFIPFPHFIPLKTFKRGHIGLIYHQLLWGQEKSGFKDDRISVGRNSIKKYASIWRAFIRKKSACSYATEAQKMFSEHIFL